MEIVIIVAIVLAILLGVLIGWAILMALPKRESAGAATVDEQTDAPETAPEADTPAEPEAVAADEPAPTPESDADAEAEVHAETDALQEALASQQASTTATRAGEAVFSGVEHLRGEKIKHNDLTEIEGIGPKIATILKDNGMDTWAALAEKSPEEIKAVLLEKGGKGYARFNPGTWPTQAGLLAEGKFAEFEELTDKLVGGK